MRRKIIKPFTPKSICIGVHPSFFEKMEEIRRVYLKEAGISLSQKEITDLISKRLRPPKVPTFLKHGKSKKKIRSY